MTDKDWLLLTTLEETGSLIKAAEKLYVSQPALSQALLRLEKELKATLFKRTHQGLVPTIKGKKAILAAHQMLKLKRDLENELKAPDQNRRGHLVIGITNYLGSMLLPGLLKNFSARFPRVEIEIVEATSDELEEMIRTMKVDLGILHAPLTKPHFKTIPLLSHRFVLALDANMAKQKTEEDFFDLRKLSDAEWIMLYPEQRIRQVSDHILDQLNITPTIRMLTRSYETARNLAACGVGVTLLPEEYLRFFKTENPPAIYPLDPRLEASWTLVAGYALESKPSELLQALIETLKDTLVQLEGEHAYVN